MKQRYRLHHERLVFVKEKKSFRKIIWNVMLYLLAIAFMTVAYYIVYSLFFDTLEERAQKRENDLLREGTLALTEKMNRVEEVIGQLQDRDKEIYKAIFRADIIPLHTAVENSYETYAALSNADLVNHTTTVMRDLTLRSATITRLMNRLTTNLKNMTKDSLLAIPLLQPVKNDGLAHVGASVGMRMHPFYKLLKQHTGIDFIAGMGTEVYATALGTVSGVYYSLRGTGRRVEIDHGNGYVTTYSHLNEILVQKGQRVTRGQVIARVGDSGMSIYPHLHYEVIKNGAYMDPLNYFFIGLLPEDYDMLRQLSISSGQSLD